jgi:hypothetical protein
MEKWITKPINSENRRNDTEHDNDRDLDLDDE